jgi:hypothetical protein
MAMEMSHDMGQHPVYPSGYLRSSLPRTLLNLGNNPRRRSRGYGNRSEALVMASWTAPVWYRLQTI